MAEKNIFQIFNNLKTGIVGTKTSKIDDQIDSAISNIQKISAVTDRNRYIDVIKNLVHNVGGPDTKEILKDVNHTGGIDSFQQGDRLNRYREYEAIVANISYCKRALRVLVDNILSPDDITKRTIQIISEQEEDGVTKSELSDTIISRLKEIKTDTKIEKYIDRLVTGTMKKGDFFIEILYSPKGQHALSIVSEQTNEKFLNENFSINESIEFDITLTDNANIKNTIDKHGRITILEYSPLGSFFNGTTAQPNTNISTYSKYDVKGHSKAPQKVKGVEDDEDDPWKRQENKKDRFKNKFKDKKEDPATNAELKDLFLAFHDPQYIIRLETERFRTCLGYLVFPKVDISQIYSNAWSVQTNDVDGICARIINQLQNKIQAGNDMLPNISDLRDVIGKYLKHIRDNDDLKIRYVPPHMMSHWRIGVDRFDPYGESIFECVKFDCKLLMAQKTAKTIKMLSSATDKRLISVETGLPRDAKNLVEMIKEGLRKRKISIDNFGSVDTIPSHISTFEDIYVPMRDGKKFVEFDHIQFGPDPQNDIEPLKFQRDNIVANLNVPAPFLGLEENTCSPSYTKIPLLNGQNVEIGKIVEQYERDPDNFDIWVHSLDVNSGKVVPGKVLKAMWTRKNAQLVRIHLDNDKHMDFTPDHRIMMRDGSYKEAKDLQSGDSLMALDSSHKNKNDILVVNVEWLEERQDCCDIEVEKYHNFAVSAGVFVHNSNRALLTVENIMFARTVISYQMEFSMLLKDVFEKIYLLMYPDGISHLENIKITFPPPKASPYEHQMEYIEQMQRIIEALATLGVPKSWLKKYYLPDLPWDEIEKSAAEEKLKQESGEESKDDEQGGYGGLGGGGFTGAF